MKQNEFVFFQKNFSKKKTKTQHFSQKEFQRSLTLKEKKKRKQQQTKKHNLIPSDLKITYFFIKNPFIHPNSELFKPNISKLKSIKINKLIKLKIN